MHRVTSVLGVALIWLTGCVERTEETEAIRQENIRNKSSGFYHEAFVKMVPQAYWRICELAVREGFDFDKVVETSKLDIASANTVEGHKNVSLNYRGNVVMHVQKPIAIPSACYMNGWTTDINDADAMIEDAISAIKCSALNEVEPQPAFAEQNGRSFVCGDTLLHASVQELKSDRVFVGIAVERNVGAHE